MLTKNSPLRRPACKNFVSAFEALSGPPAPQASGMRTPIIILAAALLSVPAVCADHIASLHPLAAADSPALVFEPALLGKWTYVEITRGKDNLYDIDLGSDEHKRSGTVRLLKLGDVLIFDLTLEETPLHLFGKLRIEGDSLEVWFMDSDWLRDEIVARGQPRHEVLEDGMVVLTASSQELWQSLVVPYLNDPRAFETDATLEKSALPQSSQSTPSAADTPASRRYDLTGIWYNPKDPGYEIQITQAGDLVFATKTVSNIYVPAGQISWQGAFISDSTIKATLQFASAGYVDPYWEDVTIEVKEGGNRLGARGPGGTYSEAVRR